MPKQFNYGGQAVMEGVMMRGQRDCAICVRAPSGLLVTRREPLTAQVYRGKAFRLPFLRGLVMLWDALGLGMRALMWSAGIAASEDEEAVSFSGPLAWGTVAVSLAMGVGLFVLLPMLLVSFLDQRIAMPLVSNVAEGFLRLWLFVGYLLVIGRLPEISRVFAYHGAEHKTINAYEQGAQLEPQTVAEYSRTHTRCGTGFMLVILVFFVLITTLLGRPPLVWRLLSRIALLPILACISYEWLRLSSRFYARSMVVRCLAAPGLALQRLTTREPDEAMLEVSIAALHEVLASEGLESVAEDAPAVQVSLSPAS